MKVQELLNTIGNITKYTGMLSGGRERIREVIRIKYNHTCQSCGEKWEVGSRRFDIHHKDCNKEKTRQIDRNEDLDNLICLCHQCHFDFHYNQGKNWKERAAENFHKFPKELQDRFTRDLKIIRERNEAVDNS